VSTVRLALASAVARAAAIALRASGSGGTSAPGKILLALAPDAIAQRSAALDRGSAVISATNGKTTTSSIVAEIMRGDGATLVHNRAGANMAGGIAATLNDQRGDFGLFEVDEFWLASLVSQLRPRSVLLANLFRDQLDRYGELDLIVDRWRDVAASATGRIVLNADDPLVAGLGAVAHNPLFYGIEDLTVGSDNPQHASEQACCPVCGEQFSYSRFFVGHLGHYYCPQGHFQRPTPQVTASDIALNGLGGSTFTLAIDGRSYGAELAMPGLYNVYNAVAAAALANSLGVSDETIVTGIRDARPAFGRAETVEIAGRACSIMLIKNPAGTNEVLRTLASDPLNQDLLIVLNDQIADGRDISWIWDADFEQLAQSQRVITCSGGRAVELGLRLKYAGVDPERISVRPVLDEALAATLDGDGERLVILPTYTAMLAVRELLVSRGAAPGSFQ
jgi:lipid II isoglutaminyl synthase (glutamine-hydrolysing)